MAKVGIHKIDLVIHPTKLYVSFGNKYKDVCKKLGFRYKDSDDLKYYYDAMTNSCANGDILMLFESKRPKNDIIIHEIIHAKNYLNTNLGGSLFSTMADEPEAYLVKHIFNEIKKCLKQKTQKND